MKNRIGARRICVADEWRFINVTQGHEVRPFAGISMHSNWPEIGTSVVSRSADT